MIRIIPMMLNDAADFEGVIRFQLLHKDPRNLEIRLLCEEGADRDALFQRTRENIEAVLARYGAENVTIVLSDKLPMNDHRGKFKQVYREAGSLFEGDQE